MKDYVRAISGDQEPAIYAPIAGPWGSFALMQLSDEELRDYYAIQPKQGQHQVCIVDCRQGMCLPRPLACIVVPSEWLSK
jgi:hypothetical protein